MEVSICRFTFVPNNPERLMRIFKSTTSLFTFKELPDGKQICLVAGGLRTEHLNYSQPGEDVYVSSSYIRKWFIELKFTNYIKQCELLMKEK